MDPSENSNPLWRWHFRRIIPWALVYTRVVLAPIAILLSLKQAPSWIWMSQFGVACLSDWLDGKLARRWGSVTPKLRQADSIADTIYTLGITISLWIKYPEVIFNHRWLIWSVIILEALRYPLDWFLFRRSASYHAISAKLFGLSLLIAFTCIMGFGYVGPVLKISLIIGIISEVEGILISLVLPEWTHDVSGIWRAFAIRNQRAGKDNR